MQTPVQAPLVAQHQRRAGQGDQGIEDGRVEGQGMAAAQQAAERVEQGVEAEDHQHAAVERQHQWLEVPVTLLEAPPRLLHQQP
ncbi:hypothetical protein D3C85_1674230 [compost metagenome]